MSHGLKQTNKIPPRGQYTQVKLRMVSSKHAKHQNVCTILQLQHQNTKTCAPYYSYNTKTPERVHHITVTTPEHQNVCTILQLQYQNTRTCAPYYSYNTKTPERVHHITGTTPKHSQAHRCLLTLNRRQVKLFCVRIFEVLLSPQKLSADCKTSG